MQVKDQASAFHDRRDAPGLRAKSPRTGAGLDGAGRLPGLRPAAEHRAGEAGEGPGIGAGEVMPAGEAEADGVGVHLEPLGRFGERDAAVGEGQDGCGGSGGRAGPAGCRRTAAPGGAGCRAASPSARNPRSAPTVRPTAVRRAVRARCRRPVSAVTAADPRAARRRTQSGPPRRPAVLSSPRCATQPISRPGTGLTLQAVGPLRAGPGTSSTAPRVTRPAVRRGVDGRKVGGVADHPPCHVVGGGAPHPRVVGEPVEGFVDDLGTLRRVRPRNVEDERGAAAGGDGPFDVVEVGREEPTRSHRRRVGRHPERGEPPEVVVAVDVLPCVREQGDAVGQAPSVTGEGQMAEAGVAVEPDGVLAEEPAR